jgi:hypothetical protein
MRTVLLMTFGLALTPISNAASIPVVTRNGVAHVTAAALEREAGIAVKRLPRPGEFTACGTNGCFRLRGVLAEGDTWLVPVSALSQALNLTATFDGRGDLAALKPGPSRPADASGLPRVGTLVPNLRFTRLDGTAVSLDELRGQRVLINSWASW